MTKLEGLNCTMSLTPSLVLIYMSILDLALGKNLTYACQHHRQSFQWKTMAVFDW